MNPIAESTAQEIAASQRNFMSDTFHTLSQPLTALHCSLELSLARDRTCEEFRASVEAALQNAERLRHSLQLLRELRDADDPGEISGSVELRQLLLELREDLLPVFESSGRDFDVVCNPVLIQGNKNKLTRGFLYLLEYLLRSSPRDSLSIRVEQAEGRQVRISITLSGAGSSTAEADQLCEPTKVGEVEIARRTLRAVGGDLVFVSSPREQSIWLATLLLTLSNDAKAERQEPLSCSAIISSVS